MLSNYYVYLYYLLIMVQVDDIALEFRHFPNDDADSVYFDCSITGSLLINNNKFDFSAEVNNGYQ